MLVPGHGERRLEVAEDRRADRPGPTCRARRAGATTPPASASAASAVSPGTGPLGRGGPSTPASREVATGSARTPRRRDRRGSAGAERTAARAAAVALPPRWTCAEMSGSQASVEAARAPPRRGPAQLGVLPPGDQLGRPPVQQLAEQRAVAGLRRVAQCAHRPAGR